MCLGCYKYHDIYTMHCLVTYRFTSERILRIDKEITVWIVGLPLLDKEITFFFKFTEKNIFKCTFKTVQFNTCQLSYPVIYYLRTIRMVTLAST